MIIAGIDPSLSNFGMAKGTLAFAGVAPQFELQHLVLAESKSDKANAKSVRKNSDDIARARSLFQALHRFIDDVDLVVVEVPVGSQSARSMASYGVCIGLIASIQKPLIQVTPAEVKLAACQSKTASKNDMIQWATQTHPDAPWLTQKRGGESVLVSKNEHLADALGAIYAGFETDEFKQMSVVYQTFHTGGHSYANYTQYR